MALRQAGTLAVKLAQTAGAFASGRSYVQRYFPPGYREHATKLITAFEQAALGAGLYQVYNTFMNDDGTTNPNAIPKKVPFRNPGTFNKTRDRQRRYTSGNRSSKRRPHRCNCRPKKRYF